MAHIVNSVVNCWV